MQKNLTDIEEAGVQLAAISYDDVNTLQSFASTNEITFPLLSDQGTKADKSAGSQAIKRYGLLDTRERGKYNGVPIPATIVIGRDKKVRHILSNSISERHSVSALLQAIGELDNE